VPVMVPVTIPWPEAVWGRVIKKNPINSRRREVLRSSIFMELPHSRRSGTGNNRVGCEALIDLLHGCRTSKSRDDDPEWNTCLVEFQTVSLF
jgi:hypothetical protein